MKRRKRIFMAFFAVMAVLFAPVANAATQKIELIDARIIDKSATVTADELDFTDNTISSNITFGKEKDSIEIEFQLKNTSDEDYRITGVTDNTSSNLATEYHYSSDVVTKDSTTDVRAIITYAQKALNVDKISFDNITITFELTKEDGTKETFTLNPKTNDNIINYVIIAAVSTVALITIITSKKKQTKFIACVAMLIGAIVLPMTTIALEEEDSAIKLTNIDIIGEYEAYAISFNPDNGDDETTKEIRYGTTIAELPAAPNKNGYEFSKWVDEDGNEVTADTRITAQISVKASYTPIDYDINYTLNDGSVENNPTSYNIETDTFTLNEPTKQHYVFVGWTGSNGTNPQKQVSISRGTTGELNYTANYTPKTYTITFNATDGQIADTDMTRNVAYGNQIGDLPTATQEGFGLAGWFTSADGGTKIDKNTIVSGSTEYYAHWLDNSTLATNIVAGKANQSSEYEIDFIKKAVISDNVVTANGNGVNQYREGNRDIYYFRGEIYDNNVIWADKCWKILRTTKTGGTKLVYNGEPTEVDVDGETTLQCLATGQETLIENVLDEEATDRFVSYNDGDACDVEGACSIAYMGYMYGTPSMIYKFRPTSTSTYYFSDSVTVGSTKSTLVTGNGHSYKGSWQNEDFRNQVKENHHYFCPLNNKYECNNSQLKWKFYAPSQYIIYALSLNGYDNPDDLIADMQQDISDSNVKRIIDTWYEQNLAGKADDLEDTVFCGEKDFGKGPLYDHKNSGVNSYTVVSRRVGGYDNQRAVPSLDCNSKYAYTTSDANGNGKLKYKIGLISADEAALAGAGRMDAAPEGYLTGGVKYWTMSPYAMVGSTPYHIVVGHNGGQTSEYIRKSGNSTLNIGIRPSVSLKAGTRFTGGSGLKTDPYIVE